MTEEGVTPRWRLVMTFEDMKTIITRAAHDLSSPEATVLDVGIEWRTDLGEDPLLLVTLSLAAPAGGQETWPVEALYHLRQGLRLRAGQEGLPAELSISWRSVDDDENESEEPADALDEALRNAEPER